MIHLLLPQELLISVTSFLGLRDVESLCLAYPVLERIVLFHPVHMNRLNKYLSFRFKILEFQFKHQLFSCKHQDNQNMYFRCKTFFQNIQHQFDLNLRSMYVYSYSHFLILRINQEDKVEYEYEILYL